MSELFVQNITAIGESKNILELLNVPVPKNNAAEGAIWSLTHLHFKATMRGMSPIALHKLSKENPNIVLAVTSGSTTGPTYRFLMQNGKHVPIQTTYQQNLTPHYIWSESISPNDVTDYIKRKTPGNMAKIERIMKLAVDELAIDEPDIEVKIIEEEL